MKSILTLTLIFFALSCRTSESSSNVKDSDNSSARKYQLNCKVDNPCKYSDQAGTILNKYCVESVKIWANRSDDGALVRLRPDQSNPQEILLLPKDHNLPDVFELMSEAAGIRKITASNEITWTNTGHFVGEDVIQLERVGEPHSKKYAGSLIIEEDFGFDGLKCDMVPYGTNIVTGSIPDGTASAN